MGGWKFHQLSEYTLTGVCFLALLLCFPIVKIFLHFAALLHSATRQSNITAFCDGALRKNHCSGAPGNLMFYSPLNTQACDRCRRVSRAARTVQTPSEATTATLAHPIPVSIPDCLAALFLAVA